ncbi:MAG: hypothetical protein K0R14_492 [Burkholderiales bacterium]|jgi:hypothetical protein|nr:hypothetical protein [Burkholderiales bacterium]
MQLFTKHLKKIFMFLGFLLTFGYTIAVGAWPTPPVSWSLQYGGDYITDNFTSGKSISISSDGKNVYATGTTSNSLYDQKQNGHYDAWIASYNNDNGNLNWARQLGALGGITHGVSISTDSNNNIYAVGHTNVDISNVKNTGGTDFFITKYSSNGTELWTKLEGGARESDTTKATAIATDKAGNSYVIGDTTVGVLGKSQTGTTDYFIAKYDTQGKLLWANQTGESGAASYASAIALGSNGHLYITGYGHNSTSKGNYLIVAEYNATTGKLMGSKSIKNPDDTDISGSAITLDSNGNVYIGGTTSIGSTDFSQVSKYFIQKYTFDVEPVWAIVGGDSAYGRGISLDNLGNIYVTGFTYKETNYINYFIAKVDTSGHFVGSFDVGGDGPAEVFGYGIQEDSNNNLYVIGSTSTSLYGMPMIGPMDFFIVKYKYVD